MTVLITENAQLYVSLSITNELYYSLTQQRTDVRLSEMLEVSMTQAFLTLSLIKTELSFLLLDNFR